MDSQLPSRLRNDNSALSSLPIELTIRFFCLLPSFSDVFALAQTSRRFSRIWTENVTTIYNEVSPRGLSCEHYARIFLSDQGGPTPEKQLSAQDVFCMVRNSRRVERAILQFELEIVPKVKCGVYDAPESYGPPVPGRNRHPPHLTRGERARFIRIYYQLWGLMKLETPNVQARLDSIRLKDLFLLYEMSRLNQSIGLEEVLPSFPDPQPQPGSVRAIRRRPSEKRRSLEKLIWELIEKVYQRIHNDEPDYPWVVECKEDGYMYYRIMWDHWQSELKGISCSRGSRNPNVEPKDKQESFYADSSDEEFET
ncbi:hypothetical protein LSUB1_G007619 [Lachnellula subtilissima]|uniref:F-box domain-containing protein n=1 Tax=Lachnellula subtilissima TaxID=602034 RepID=A0A8H8U5U4_9HELO|nr:hypothetical protein LSUB1_G007619 [Lachnellula subtilissima]